MNNTIMLTIIDYGDTEASIVADALKKISAEFIISSKEADVLSSDKLILPDSEDITSSIKKLHLLNLFSILRMIKKPILGIGTGMHLMCESFRDNKSACLGCFPVECVKGNQQLAQEYLNIPVSIINESKLLKDVTKDDRFYFRIRCFIPLNEHTTSVAAVNGDITASVELQHLHGVQFNPEKSGGSGLKVLNNFLKL